MAQILPIYRVNIKNDKLLTVSAKREELDERRMKVDTRITRGVDSLHAKIQKVRSALNLLRKESELLSEKLMNVKDRSEETVESLKGLVKNIDRKKYEQKKRARLMADLVRREAIAQGKYKDLLAGDLPGTEELSSGDLLTQKEKFLGAISKAFEELDTQLNDIREQKEKGQAEQSDTIARIRAGEKRRDLLFTKLSIYKKEISEYVAELSKIESAEKLILTSYELFADRISHIESIDKKAMKLVDEILQSAG